MTVRKIEKGIGRGYIGKVAGSTDARAKTTEINSVVVYPEHGYGVGIKLEKAVHPSKSVVLNLTMTTAIEVVKGILQNLSDVTIAVDEELLGIIAQAKKRSDADAKAVVDCIKRTPPGS